VVQDLTVCIIQTNNLVIGAIQLVLLVPDGQDQHVVLGQTHFNGVQASRELQHTQI
jgi:hypothetical protein